MTNKKLMVISDASTAATGFGRVAEAILDRLHDKGWLIKQVGINYFDSDHDKPYRIFAATGGGNFADWIGYKRVRPLYDEIKPDVVLLFQDFWHVSEYINRLPDDAVIVTYFPVDSPNVKYTWALPQAAATEVCTYTQFGVKEFVKAMKDARDEIVNTALAEGKDTIKVVNLRTSEGVKDLAMAQVERLCDPKNINIIPHGVDTNNFYHVDKLDARRQVELPLNAFIVGNVNRNQPRKRLDLCIKAFSEFAQDKDDVVLILHDSVSTPEGWDLAQLAHYYGVKDKVMISQQKLDVEVLNYLYNSLDVMVNSSGGEGWGLTSFESASCKVPQIVPEWSATKEIWEGTALMTNVIGVKHEAGKINTAQCVIDTHHLAEQLQYLYDNPEERERIGEECFKVTTRPEYDWDLIADQFDKVLKNAIRKGRPKQREVTLR